MTTEFSGRGNPRRIMELLWGKAEAGKRGPKPGHTVEHIVQAAIAFADTEGLAALSMRKIAASIGISPMSLYTYVPGKAELLDLMIDAVHLEPNRPPHVPGKWRQSLEQIARERWALCFRHPWLVHVAMSRPVMGPGTMLDWEYTLAAVDGIGLNELEMDSVATLITSFAHSTARGLIETRIADTATGRTEIEWWTQYEPLVEELISFEKYPVASRVGPISGEAFGAGDYNHNFEFGLERMLDGIEVLVNRRRGNQPVGD